MICLNLKDKCIICFKKKMYLKLNNLYVNLNLIDKFKFFYYYNVTSLTSNNNYLL